MFWVRISRCNTPYISSYKYSLSYLAHNGRIISHIPSKLAVRYWHGTRSISSRSLENTKVEHSQFLANASAHSKWSDRTPGNGTTDSEDEELAGIQEGVGKLLPTTSHLFKLILPLRRDTNGLVPTVLLLHPSQPLSHAGRLILASLPRSKIGKKLSISFRCSPSISSRRFVEYSDSIDISDFVREAARATEFKIYITADSTQEEENNQVLSVRVPSFADRTRFLRRRLDVINFELTAMEGLKRECDALARKGARRVALSGFGMLVAYWAAVARLTFWDYGWDVMEPITYLSGLSTVICGYLWFLYQGREVSYSSVLDRSVSARRENLYKQRGLDIEKWTELASERRKIMKEIGQIKEDYEQSEEEKDKSNKDEGENKDNEADEKDSLLGEAEESEPSEPKSKGKK
ncbi:hypothetical protein BDP27DRAFT_1281203 [Rhodocollybia butyracea]|uniref:Calcium uniporter protein, mitochondrial n=1 Tax=Rhodocollybia butyracea TaxID=206335 RepID=A0A9P5QCV4_9AGAR|nr:hypothetical protein BDP27DRAFT_1281203 [Rhodocollybia butyracea]